MPVLCYAVPSGPFVPSFCVRWCHSKKNCNDELWQGLCFTAELKYEQLCANNNEFQSMCESMPLLIYESMPIWQYSSLARPGHAETWQACLSSL